MKKNVTMFGMIVVTMMTFIPWIYIRGIWEQGPVAGSIPSMAFVPVMIALAIVVGIMNLMVASSTIKFIIDVMKARYRRAFRK